MLYGIIKNCNIKVIHENINIIFVILKSGLNYPIVQLENGFKYIGFKNEKPKIFILQLK